MGVTDGWVVPPDPDLGNMARSGLRQWELDRPKVLAFDTETRGLSYHDPAFGVSLAWVSDDIVQGRHVYGSWWELDRVDTSSALRRIFEEAQVLVAHNAKFDMHKLELAGIVTPEQWDGYEIHDTEAMAHLLDEHRRKGLKDLMVSVLGWDDTVDIVKRRRDKDSGEMVEYIVKIPREKVELDEAKKWAKKHHGLGSIEDVGYHLLPRGTLVPYAIMDAVATYHLGAKLHPQILEYPDLTELYNREMKLSRVIAGMERAGMATDQEYVSETIHEYRRRVLAHETRIEGIVGRQVRTGKIPASERDEYFNPASTKEIAEYFTKVEGKSRDSYDADSLRTIEHPLATCLLEYRADAKILQTYLEPLKHEVGEDGIYHMSLRQHGTVSGRTSAGAERGDQ